MPEEYCRKPLAAALLLMASSFLLAQGSPSPQDPLANSDLPLLDFGASLLGLGRDRRQVLAGSPARSSFEEELLAVTRGQVDDGLFLQNLQQDVQPQGGREEPALWQYGGAGGEDVTKITDIQVQCEKTHMKVSVSFDRPFMGLIFSKGHFSDPGCVHLSAGSGSLNAIFEVRLNQCGMTSSAASTTDGNNGQPNPAGSFVESTIIVQYDPLVQEVFDQARKLRCTWYDYYEKSVTFQPFQVNMLNAVTANFLGDNLQCWMQIQSGKGPWSGEVSGIVKIGQTMTMVLGIKDEDGKFDMMVRNCVAHDGRRAPIQLVDEAGCVVRPKIMSRFQKIKNFGAAATVVSYAYFQAFKFPDSMNVHFQCVVQVCRFSCPDPVCPDDYSSSSTPSISSNPFIDQGLLQLQGQQLRQPGASLFVPDGSNGGSIDVAGAITQIQRRVTDDEGSQVFPQGARGPQSDPRLNANPQMFRSQPIQQVPPNFQRYQPRGLPFPMEQQRKGRSPAGGPVSNNNDLSLTMIMPSIMDPSASSSRFRREIPIDIEDLAEDRINNTIDIGTSGSIRVLSPDDVAFRLLGNDTGFGGGLEPSVVMTPKGNGTDDSQGGGICITLTNTSGLLFIVFVCIIIVSLIVSVFTCLRRKAATASRKSKKQDPSSKNGIKERLGDPDAFLHPQQVLLPFDIQGLARGSLVSANTAGSLPSEIRSSVHRSRSIATALGETACAKSHHRRVRNRSAELSRVKERD